jgi:hypothetical protein
MLVLRRTEGQWVEVTHRSGDKMWIRVYGLCAQSPAQVHLAFDDAPHNFEIQRPERALRPAVSVCGSKFETPINLKT